MKLLFVRHGEPDYDRDCLMPQGKREAEAVAKRLKDVPIDAFFVSPLGRARETAELTLSAVGKQAEVCDWLREFDAPIHRPDKGGERGITWDWLPQDWAREDVFLSVDTWLEHPLMREADVASEYQRVCTSFDDLLAKYGYERDGRLYRVKQANTKTLCFFCHFGVSTVLLSHLFSISPMLLWHSLAAAPASLTEVVSEERREGIASFRMNRYGDVSHIEAAGLPQNPNARFTEVYSDFSARHD